SSKGANMPKAIDYPMERTQLERGAIRWDKPFGRTKTGQYTVIIQCECGVERYMAAGDTRRKGRYPSGLCARCFHREHGATLNRGSGPASNGYKGPKRLDASGYVQVALYPGDEFYETMGGRGRKSPCRYCLEHRLVMAKQLGRPLHVWE